MCRRFVVVVLLLLCSAAARAQFRTQAQQLVLTYEDSLQQGFSARRTVISGYGSASYRRDLSDRTATADLERAVLFVGHQFNRSLYFFSELEIEHAIVAADKPAGEIAMEQAYLKFNLNRDHYLVAGLFLPRIGLLNENHLPVNFNGVERPLVEQLVIPATWRELGVGLYGKLPQRPLYYTLALMNGLDGAAFEHGTGIREGRTEGGLAKANNLAVSASLQYSFGDVKAQVSGYAGGTVGLNPRAADSLRLNSGAFGTPVYLGEADLQYSRNGISARLLGCYIAYPEASSVNRAYAKNLPTSIYGAYAEAGFDLLTLFHSPQQLIAFARLESFDLNASTPAQPEGAYDPTLQQQHLIAGFSYFPIPNVVVKADVRLMQTGAQNPDLVINPAPNALPYQTHRNFLNLGIGYSF